MSKTKAIPTDVQRAEQAEKKDRWGDWRPYPSDGYRGPPVVLTIEGEGRA